LPGACSTARRNSRSGVQGDKSPAEEYLARYGLTGT
jgi:hypothetical protein